MCWKSSYAIFYKQNQVLRHRRLKTNSNEIKLRLRTKNIGDRIYIYRKVVKCFRFSISNARLLKKIMLYYGGVSLSKWWLVNVFLEIFHDALHNIIRVEEAANEHTQKICVFKRNPMKKEKENEEDEE